MKYSVCYNNVYMYVIIHFSKPSEYTTPRVNTKVNYGFGVMVCQSRFWYNKCYTSLMGGVDAGEGCV